MKFFFSNQSYTWSAIYLESWLFQYQTSAPQFKRSTMVWFSIILRCLDSCLLPLRIWSHPLTGHSTRSFAFYRCWFLLFVASSSRKMKCGAHAFLWHRLSFLISLGMLLYLPSVMCFLFQCWVRTPTVPKNLWQKEQL